jgi:unsaturated chondroitin disaccharide hydrolase
MKQSSRWKLFTILILYLFVYDTIFAQNQSDKNTLSKNKIGLLIEEQFKFAVQQYKVLNANIPRDVMPKSFNAKTNKVETNSTWCSGFYPGTLLYIYEYTKDSEIKKETENRLAILEKEKDNKSTHDIGFMIYCSFGNAYRLFGNQQYRAIIDTAAASLASRYRPSIKAIQSWDRQKKTDCPVIIDNMMNLELLNWASENGADPKFKEIAIAHANTTMQNHFRADYSSYQSIILRLGNRQSDKKSNPSGSRRFIGLGPWPRLGFIWLYHDVPLYKRQTLFKTC